MAIFSALPSYNCGHRVLGDLVHYYHGRANEVQDYQQVANAMEAYAQLKIMAR
jgi:hypothetical protein